MRGHWSAVTLDPLPVRLLIPGVPEYALFAARRAEEDQLPP